MVTTSQVEPKCSSTEASEKAVCGCSNPLRAKLVRTRSYADLPHLSMSSSWLQGLLRPGQAWQRYFPQCERVIVHHIPVVGACIRKQQRSREHSQGEHCTPTTPHPFLCTAWQCDRSSLAEGQEHCWHYHMHAGGDSKSGIRYSEQGKRKAGSCP